METLYHQTNKLVQEIQQLLQQLNNYVGDSSSIESAILKKIDDVNGYKKQILIGIRIKYTNFGGFL